MVGFSDIASLEEILDILGIKSALDRKKYSYAIHATYDEISILLKDLNGHIQDIPSIESTITSEKDKEFICRYIIARLIRAINTKLRLNLKISAGDSLKTSITQGENHTGQLDFCVYREASAKIKRILTVFEVKKGLIQTGAGQLVAELVAVYSQNNSKAYGFVTNAQSWQLYTYEKVEEKNIVEVYEIIQFCNSSAFDIETLFLLSNVVIDIIALQ